MPWQTEDRSAGAEVAIPARVVALVQVSPSDRRQFGGVIPTVLLGTRTADRLRCLARRA